MGQLSNIMFDGFDYHHSLDDYPDNEAFFMHCHNYYEIYYFISGEGKYVIEGTHYDLKNNSIIIIRPNEFHYFKIERPVRYERCSLHFNLLNLDKTLSNSLLLSPFLDRPLGQHNLLQPLIEDNVPNIFKRLEDTTKLPKDERVLKAQFILGELMSTIVTISKRIEYSIQEDNFPLAAKILQYINLNISIRLSLEDLSEHFFISKSHLCHTFKSYSGVSIIEYILRKKVALSKELLDIGKKPTIVAKECGFGNYSSFYRAYKRITGKSPCNY